ncbi:uncharacterized protein TOT_040000923 [Theileria orientalis strain Shintoku]|uniref:Uncharacterized protein n=1 Tax=Theileria orientalis strain Shintoku TaxID=869250 RepID=J4C927_THEOR|nr:uncharacterized protein TOT_040000923 [Theileria orientalis strain Shintoku]BAM41808.1 uncharacterized protein TOT_040000923 [Theileria orientalis strain Shintoku]|eukprot:XP_009692109.1 uncharacterized protein TOT_040000923 [Theileria orientalis strain Shintoku]
MSYSSNRLSSLLKLLSDKNLDSFVVNHGDPHASEYFHHSFDRISFISGFTGSYGLALVTHSKCYLWTDSRRFKSYRYFIQAERQLSEPWVLMKLHEKGFPTLTEFLSTSTDLKRVGFDSNTTTYTLYKHWMEKVKDKEFVGLSDNPVDAVWAGDRPAFPLGPLKIYPLKYSGVSVSEKLVSVRDEMKKNNVNALALTNLDDVAYMLNLRGSDVECSPLFYAYLLVEMEKITLFVDHRKLDDETKTYLKSFSVETRDYNDLFPYVENLGTGEKGVILSKFRMWASPSASVYLCTSFLKNNTESTPRELHLEVTPVCDLKASKNDTELKCMVEAHVLDGIALAKFFAKVYEMKDNGTLFDKDEYDLGELSSEVRYEQESNAGLSFPPISSVGENGAVVHYRAEKDNCSKIGPHMYLLDSGGQYLTGTTDVTRTIHFGKPTEEEKKAYTLVLKGHLALRHAVFPDDTPGQTLDVLARQYLWNHGMNYYHSTGHGVGAYLNVHEGPCAISSLFKPTVGKVNVTYLKPGMVLSNEPGYYKAGHFGVRIENMVYVKKVEGAFSKDHREFLEFEDLTLVPYCKDLLDFTLLTRQELDRLNEYHKRIADTLVPRMVNMPGYDKAIEFLKKCAEPL